MAFTQAEEAAYRAMYPNFSRLRAHFTSPLTCRYCGAELKTIGPNHWSHTSREASRDCRRDHPEGGGWGTPEEEYMK